MPLVTSETIPGPTLKLSAGTASNPTCREPILELMDILRYIGAIELNIPLIVILSLVFLKRHFIGNELVALGSGM